MTELCYGVDQSQSGRLPLHNIGVCGKSEFELLFASRLARQFGTEVRVSRADLKNRDREQNCIVVGNRGLAGKTRVDIPSWNAVRKDQSIAVAMMLNPGDTGIEKIGAALDDKIEVIFEPYQLTREKRRELFERLSAGAESSPEFILFMAVATFLACIGLIQNSAAVIIGAMLVAPLMTPLLGAALAMIYGNLPLFMRAVRSIMIGIGLSFVLGMMVGFIVMLFSRDLLSGVGFGLTDEMIARSAPNFLDPFIGLLAGLAGGFAIGRDGQIGTVAGVAIAAALVPPIATAGLEAAITVSAVFHSGDISTLTTILFSDPREILQQHDLFLGTSSTSASRLVLAPLILFLLNAFTTIIGANVGMRLVGMHRSSRPKQSRKWVAGVFLLLFVLSCLFVLLAVLSS